MSFHKLRRTPAFLRARFNQVRRKIYDRGIQEAALLRRIREEFPQIKWKSHRYITCGWNHAVVILDERLVFRAPKSTRYRKEFKYEIGLLHRLGKEVKIGIPNYRFVSRDKLLAGYDFLPGCELTSSCFQQLSVKEKEIVAQQLATFVTALHATPKSTVDEFHVRLEDQRKLYEELVRETRRLLFRRLSEVDVRLCEQYFSELESVLHQDFTRALVHNDLTSEHILWDGGNQSVNVIDFSDRRYGDPAMDFTGFLEYGEEFTKHVLDLYGGEKDDGFLGRSQLYFKRIPIYMMNASLQGLPCTFEDGYKMFNERFKT